MNRNHSPRSTLGHVFHLERRFLTTHHWVIVAAVLGMFAGSLFLLPIPLVQGIIIDCLLDLAPSESSEIGADALNAGTWIGLGLIGSILCYVARTALAWKVTSAMNRVSLEVVREVTDAMHRKLQRLPMRYFDREETGRIMARITSDVGSLLIFLNTASLQLFSDLILALGVVAALFYLEWRLALIGLAALPFFALNHRVFSERVRRCCAQVRAQTADIYALLSERVSAIRIVRSFAEEDAELDEFDRRVDQHAAASWASMRATASEGALAFLIGGIGSVAILMAGVSLIRQDLMTIGELLAFYALAAQLYGPITRLAHFHGILSATSVALERIGEVLDEPEMLSDNPRVLPVGPAPGALVFDEVTFSYPGRVKPALRKATLRVEPGMTIGILGPSGAGKSTLLALAAQLYEVPKGQGAIRFGNTDIRELGTADVRRAILLVPQNAVLFEGTLRSNLVYARPDASEADVLKAIRVAHLAKLVENLPLGLDTPVGERGVNLSGGQRQRMALARALIANPAMLLLDDCTSALDAATETHILRELAAAYPDQTRIVVSHKLTTIARADLIIVMDDGQIVEQGTHAELAARAGFYTRTRTLQLPKIAVDPSPFDVPAPA